MQLTCSVTPMGNKKWLELEGFVNRIGVEFQLPC